MPGARHKHEIALELRNFEIELFWKRSNYFLVLNSAIFIAFFSNKIPANVFVCIIGVVICWFWYRTNLGSKFWQERWESAVDSTEEDYHKNSTDNLAEFFNTVDVKSIVDKNLSKPGGRWEKRFFRKQILNRPSVSFTMIKLSLFFLGIWGLMFLYEIHKYCSCQT